MDISRLGREFAQYVQQVTTELLLDGTPSSLSEMERRIREQLLKIGRFLMGAWLQLQEDVYPASTVPCPCGGEAEYQRKREAVLYTLVGRVTYKRAYYLCPQCHQGCCPLDERLGLRPGRMSAELESLSGMTGAMITFGKGSNLFEQLTLVSISPQSMDEATCCMGAEMARQEKEWIAQSEDGLALRRQERAERDERRLYATLDATKVHTREQREQADEGWRDLKVGAWFRTDTPPPEEPEDDWEIHAEEITYFCDMAEAKTFGQLLWATGFQREALKARELIFLGDGAEWIWNLVEEHYPQAVQIVDWFHAAERLHTVAQASFAESQEQDIWYERMRQRLWEGKVERVIQACALLADEGSDEARKARGYFTKNKRRMRYATYRQQGYQIGSGTVESGCKQIGLQRMKVAGARWSLAGARYTAKARAALLSDQWPLLTSRREHLPKAA